MLSLVAELSGEVERLRGMPGNCNHRTVWAGRDLSDHLVPTER